MRLQKETPISILGIAGHWKIWIIGILISSILAFGLYAITQYYDSQKGVAPDDDTKLPDDKYDGSFDLRIALLLTGISIVLIAVIVIFVCVCLPRMRTEDVRLSFV